jgi:hypothetical protein
MAPISTTGMGHGCRTSVLNGQVINGFFQDTIQLKHQGRRIDLNQACIIAHETADEGLPRQVLPIATFQRLYLPGSKLQGLGDIANLQAPCLSRLAKLLAYGLHRGYDAIVADSILNIDLLTHSKLPFRNS